MEIWKGRRVQCYFDIRYFTFGSEGYFNVVCFTSAAMAFVFNSADNESVFLYEG